MWGDRGMPKRRLQVACLIRPDAPLFYFVNSVHAAYGVALAIVETRPIGTRLRKRFRAGGMSGLASAFRTRLRALADIRRYKADCLRVLGRGWDALDSSIPTLFVTNINGEESVRALRDIAPDLLLDHGTSLVKHDVLHTCPLGLNVHWGLAPYYRGTHCTEWALLHRDPLNIGVTLHSLSDAIDGGDIVSQARVEVEETDTVHSINMKLTRDGTKLATQAVLRLADGKQLPFVRQDLSLGRVTFLREWGSTQEHLVRQLERPIAMRDLLARPSRVAMPLVTW